MRHWITPSSESGHLFAEPKAGSDLLACATELLDDSLWPSEMSIIVGTGDTRLHAPAHRRCFAFGWMAALEAQECY